ncbi:MAG: Uncharacterized protein G01um10145_507 [Microgenomates group bacterium Gr01-1014_5]|nr:MAG: Uncharacterized protein G01um10145_507 [Microgenomates group bacterium Gr01-1014_5]
MIRILITRQARYPTDIRELRERVKTTLTKQGVGQAEVSVALVGERKMRELAQKYLGESSKYPVHEVLSFPSSGDIAFPDSGKLTQLGDIVICYPEARKIAIKRNRMMDDVIGELAQHATLHLLGIHHD